MITTESRRDADQVYLANLAQILNLPEGRYALQSESGNDKFIFIRVAKPTFGKRKGSFIVQTQHSDQLADALAHRNYASQTAQKDSFFIFKPGVIPFLVELTNQNIRFQAMQTYARINDRCARCGKKLTDNRSRWYGIGPECEKLDRWYFVWINANKGSFEDRDIDAELDRLT